MPPPLKKAPTLKDIALITGLSHPAVSKALSDNDTGTSKVSEDTKKRVRLVAMQLGYRPNAAARMLRSGKSGTIGIVHFQGIDQIATRRLLGALRAIHATEYRPYVYHIEPLFEGAKNSVAETMLDAHVEAVLFLTPPASIGQSQVDALLDAGVPVASIGSGWMSEISTFIDHRLEAYTKISGHLMSRGARKITVICDQSPSSSDSSIGAVMMEGLEAARLSLAKLQPSVAASIQADRIAIDPKDVDLEIQRNDDIFPLYVPGYLAMKKVLHQGELPDAILSQVDAHALGAMRACGEFGIQIPRDIAIAGFGNEAAASSGLLPLTTADHPIAELSRLAVEDLLLKIKGELPLRSEKRIVRRPCRFIARRSTLGTVFAQRPETEFWTKG